MFRSKDAWAGQNNTSKDHIVAGCRRLCYPLYCRAKLKQRKELHGYSRVNKFG
jgi:hypothetical protein